MSASDPSLDRRLAYGIFRVTLGVNITTHGAVRILGPGAGAFATKMAGEFAGTMLPYGFVHLFLMTLTFAEAILGALIFLGLLTRWALALGGLLMAGLVFGTALRSDWNTVSIQMIYAITYFLLFTNLADNYFSLDTLLWRRGADQ